MYIHDSSFVQNTHGTITLRCHVWSSKLNVIRNVRYWYRIFSARLTYEYAVLDPIRRPLNFRVQRTTAHTSIYTSDTHCFVSLSGLSCTTYICIWLPFLPYAYHMWLPWFVLFLFLGFSPPESLPGDDVLCRLLSRPLPSVCFLFFSFPTVFVPNLFWCNFLYLVTTAGFVADQLIM